MAFLKNKSNISDRIELVKANIASACARAKRRPENVKIVVVTKTASLKAVHEVIKLGYTDLGENRVLHLKQLAEDINTHMLDNSGDSTPPTTVNWHMIGHLQRKKVKQVLKMLSLIHSVDTLRLAEEINSVAEKFGITSEILLQVNCSGEPQKYGAPVGAVTHLAEQVATMDNIRIHGLMTMAPLTKNKDIVRSCFIRARELFEEIYTLGCAGKDFRHLSMGMSQDYEIAIEEGATLLRIGSAIFT
jgi:pyridoxal phosphate enzyme (YggS family)